MSLWICTSTSHHNPDPSTGCTRSDYCLCMPHPASSSTLPVVTSLPLWPPIASLQCSYCTLASTVTDSLVWFLTCSAILRLCASHPPPLVHLASSAARYQLCYPPFFSFFSLLFSFPSSSPSHADVVLSGVVVVVVSFASLCHSFVIQSLIQYLISVTLLSSHSLFTL